MGKKNLAEMIERQRQASQMATSQHQAALQSHADFERRKTEAAREAWLKTPEGLAWQERQAKIELAERVAKAETAYNLRAAKLFGEGIKLDMIVVAYDSIEPIVHRTTQRPCFKIVPQSFADRYRITKNLDCDPVWYVTNDLQMMGFVAFCANPMKAGQEARIVHVSPKSCIIQPKAFVRKNHENGSRNTTSNGHVLH